MNYCTIAFLLAAFPAQNPYDRLKLTVPRAVYSASDDQGITVTLQNIGGTPISSPFYWYVHDNTKPANLNLKPWEWVTYTWDRKDHSGKKVGPGSYRLQAGPIWNGSRWETQAVTIAITPTGSIAGSSWFPLTVGNLWRYRAADGEAGELLVSDNYFGWSLIRGGPIQAMWLKYWGAPWSTLYVWLDKTYPLFRFARPVGTRWIGTPGMTFDTMQAGSADVSVVTPVGTFPQCYRIDVVKGYGEHQQPISLWFARGIGLVAYRMLTRTSDKVFRLYRAKIFGSDARWYALDRY